MSRFVIPIVIAAVVATAPITLLVIGFNGPNTHSNLASQFDPGYKRTEQSVVGSPASYRASGLAEPAPSTASIGERGRALMVAKGCASCHGLQGQGGVVGPPNAGFDLAEIRGEVREGMGGMPAFSKEQVSDDELVAIATYLKSAGNEQKAVASQAAPPTAAQPAAALAPPPLPVSQARAATGASSTSTRTVNLVAKGFALEADRLTVPTGKVRFSLRNAGGASHSLWIYPPQNLSAYLAKKRAGEEVDAKDYLRDAVELFHVKAGESGEREITLPPGYYEVADFDQGQDHDGRTFVHADKGPALWLTVIGPGFPAPTGSPANTMVVQMKGDRSGSWQFVPDKLVVPAGDVTFRVSNDMRQVHDFVIHPVGDVADLVADALADEEDEHGSKEMPGAAKDEKDDHGSEQMSTATKSEKDDHGSEQMSTATKSEKDDHESEEGVEDDEEGGHGHGAALKAINGKMLMEDLPGGKTAVKTMKLTPGTYVAACYMVSRNPDGTSFLHRDRGQRIIFTVK